MTRAERSMPVVIICRECGYPMDHESADGCCALCQPHDPQALLFDEPSDVIGGL